jgi:NAD(P)-dependent dehydrogenase (short-subunit alcohol dehydrogenase family)
MPSRGKIWFITGASSGFGRVLAQGAALAMIEVVESNDPPLRLLLGADAIGLWEAKQAVIAADLARWRAVGEATAFAGAEVKPVGG